MLTQQLQTLKDFINTDQSLAALASTPIGSEDAAIAIAAIMNLTVSPDYWVLKTTLGKHELTQQSGIDTDGTTPTAFVWGGAQGGYIARSQGERDAFKEIFNSSLSCNPSLPNVRTAFDDMFSGAGAGAVACRTHIKAMSRRKCSTAEKLYSVATVGGVGQRGSAVNPDTMPFEVLISKDDVLQARQLP